jgi:hypothetical protein
VIGGVSISSPSGSPGTLGGVLEDVSANRFGLSCAHVLSSGDDVQQPSPKDNKGAAASIGRCVHSNTLISHVPPLNSYDPSINEIDAALVEFSQRASMEILGIGQLAGMANKTQVHTNNMTVEVLGKEAGPETLVVGSTTLVHEFRFNGVMYGYRNLFVLRRASRHWGATGTLSPRSKTATRVGGSARLGRMAPNGLA